MNPHVEAAIGIASMLASSEGEWSHRDVRRRPPLTDAQYAAHEKLRAERKKERKRKRDGRRQRR